MAYDHLQSPDAGFLDGLRALLGPSGVIDAADAGGYLDEPRGAYHGRTAAVIRPATVEETAEVLRRANAARVPVIPRAGGTGLVGGQLMMDGPLPIIVSVERMRAVRSISAEDNTLVAEAGVTLLEMREAAAEIDRLFPLSLASEGTCRIGGNLATNAGGVNVIRYGNTRDLCLGIEAAMPDGSILRGLSRLRKDNTGYDLRHLLIGSEGTLGIITAASMRLFPRPAETATAFVALTDVAAGVALLRKLQDALGESISSFELMSATGLEYVFQHIEGARRPFAQTPVWSALIEVGQQGAREAFEAALGDAFEKEMILDAVLAESESQRAELWKLREEMPTANRIVGHLASHDISLPVASLAEFVARGKALVGSIDPSLEINCFGHAGDGNLHYNIHPPRGEAVAPYREKYQRRLMDGVHDLVHEFGGSFSAEHGVGRLKVSDLERYGDPTKLAMMRAIKTAIDPNGIMNPGAVLATPA